MSMRLQEIHPALVHFPITLLPTALSADAIGRLTGSESLMEMGRRTMPFAAAAALAAGISGLIAQEAVRAEGKAHDDLITHRNLNLALIGLTAILATKRSKTRRPSLGYLAAGLAGLGAMSYTAYLGGRMVYEHGVGVRPAGGVLAGAAPEVRLDNAPHVAKLAGEDIVHGAQHAAADLADGKIVPSLTDSSHDGGAGRR
ncbi:MAG: DUF2231 domain-containing protein [Gemmatimonadaceae bacterium]